MKMVTLAEVKSDLQNLADQVGSQGFVQAKALYMEKVAVVDEEGKPMKADEVEVVLMPKAAADEEEKAAHDDEENKAEHEDDEKEKSVVVARRKAVAPVAKMAAPAIHMPKVYGRIKNFKSDNNGDAVEKALRFGHWLLASRGIRKSLNFCESNGIEVKAHTEGVNSAGGYLVPEEFENELISLREEYGVFRQNARVRPMQSDTLRIPRRSATLTASFVGESAGSSSNESTMTFESVLLVAKKAMVLTTISSELEEDAFINVADDVAGEIAYAFAKKEDECGFLGDGTSTYGGITGLVNAVGSAGVISSDEASADTIAAHQTAATTEFFTRAMGQLPAYADTPNAKWYMHKTMWNALGLNRALNTGGTDARMFTSEKIGPSLFGYPVVFSQVLPAFGTLTDTFRFGYFGDLSLAASFGDRRQTSVQISDSALNAFEQDEIAIRGTERFDINIHDAGDSSEAGPIIALNMLNAS